MPKTKITDRAPTREPTETTTPLDAMRARADALYRAGVECCRQHQRHALLVNAGVDDDEQRDAWRLVQIVDELLLEAAQRYERAAIRPSEDCDRGWCQRANALWHASGQYVRRHHVTDRAARAVPDQSGARLAELSVDFDLEASALLYVQRCLEAYRAARPEAHLTPQGCGGRA